MIVDELKIASKSRGKPLIRIKNKRVNSQYSYSEDLDDPEDAPKDSRFKNVLNDVIKYDISKPGKFVNYKFKPEPEKQNIYLRKYLPEKHRIQQNVNQHNSLYLGREPYDIHNVSVRNTNVKVKIKLITSPSIFN